LFQTRWIDATRHLNAAVSLYEEAGAREMNLKDTYYLQGLLALEQGQLDVAQQWARRSFDLLQEVTHTEQGQSPEWGSYEVLSGRIALARDDTTAAARHLERGITVLKEGGLLIEGARAMYWYAHLALRQGRPERARQDLEASRAIFEQLGAVADLQRVDKELAMLSA
jgi:tetratricopeptide (TPR) repeat protein